MQSRAGIVSHDYEAQKRALAKFDKGEIPKEDFFGRVRELVETEKTALTKQP